jgi:hypothetical protein
LASRGETPFDRQHDDGVPARVRAGGKQLQRPFPGNRKVRRQDVARRVQERPDPPTGGDDEQDGIDAAVARLERESAFERLRVVRRSLELHATAPPIGADEHVPGSLIARDRKGHLRRTANDAVEARSERGEQSGARRVAQRLTSRIGPDG